MRKPPGHDLRSTLCSAPLRLTNTAPGKRNISMLSNILEGNESCFVENVCPWGLHSNLRTACSQNRKKLSAFKAETCSLCFYPFCDSFPQRCRPVNVQSNDPCREDGGVHWPAKSSPAAVLCFLLDKLMCSNGGLGACSKQSPKHANESSRRTGRGGGGGSGPRSRWTKMSQIHG